MREEDYILPELDDNLFKPVLNASVKDYEKRKGSIPKSERVPVDTFACDSMFLEHFLTEEMRDDFPLIARDFLKHEFLNVDKYDNIAYLDPDDGETGAEFMVEKHILNLMFNAYKGGSEYTKALFRYLYKIYYKKEYKQLKRFTKMTMNDVVALIVDEDGKYLLGDMSRVLTIARIYDIELGASCDPLYRYLEDEKKQLDAHDFWDQRSLDDDYKERYEKAEKKVFDIYGDAEKIYKYEQKTSRFTKKVLNGVGHSEEFIDLCDSDSPVGIHGMVHTMEILQRMSPNKEFSKSEIAIYNELRHAISAVTSSHSDLHEMLDVIMRGEEVTDFYEAFPSRFDPNEIPVSRKKEDQPKKDVNKPVRRQPDEEYSKDAMLAEIESLRLKKHQQETEIRQLRSELSGVAKLSEENKRLKNELECDHRELVALREHVYNLTEDDVNDTVPIGDMTEYLKKLRIIIIGGHSNWVNKMKACFPDWEYISPSATGSIAPSIVEHADHVYFFTDTISHSAYYRYVNVVRERNISFGYIHGVNIENNIKTIYRDLNDMLPGMTTV